MSLKSKSLYLLLAGILLLQACSISQVTPTPGPTQTPVPPTPTVPSPTPTKPPFEPLHLGNAWPTGDNDLVGGAASPDGIIYAMDKEGVLHAWDTSQNELWTYQGNYTQASSPYLSSTFIYIFTDSPNLTAINYDGTEAWTFDFDGRVMSEPLIAPDGSVYIEIYKFNEDFISDVYHLLADGTYEKFSLKSFDSLDDAFVDSKGNIYSWGWRAVTILSPDGETIKECEQKGSSRLLSNIVLNSNDEMLYIIETSRLMAMGTDCSALWNVSLDKSKEENFSYRLLYGEGDILYIGGSDGSLYALNGKDGATIWKSDAHPEIGEIISLAVLEKGLVYVVTSQAKIAVFDSQGEMKWSSQLYSPNVPDGLFALPTNELVLFHGGQVLVYTSDPSMQYAFPAGAEPPATEEQAREEIVTFVLDFIVKYEIGETADYIRTSGMPWVDSPPEANIIVYAPALENAENSWEYLDNDNPITVWWYADGELIIVEDKQKAIEEYQKNYMDNPASDIFAWGSYDFGIVKLSSDFLSADLYIGASCGPLCGHGMMYKIQRSPSGEWWIYDSTHLWQS